MMERPTLAGWARAPQLFALQWLLASLTAAEAEAVASLHGLNAGYARAFAEPGASWYHEHLSDDFVCTLADGRRLDKARFLRLSAEPVADVTCDEIDVRPFGQLALVHGVAHHSQGGSPASTRYTHVWLFRDDRWQLAAAQFTRVAVGEAPRLL